MYFLGIDLGISNIKVCLIDLNGSELVVFRYKSKYKVDDGLFKEQDVGNIFDKIVESIIEIKKQKPLEFSEISSLSVSSNGNTFVLLDKGGNELTNGISVFDKRANEENKIINSLIDSMQNYKISGQIEHLDIHSDSKLLWFKNNRKDIYERVYKVVFLEDYINYKMTGNFVIDRSVACISGLFDLRKKSWRQDILEIIGLKEKNFSEILDGGCIISNISGQFAELTGLSRNVNVVTGLLDQLSNSIGAGNVGFEKAVECTGTVLSVVVNAPDIVIDDIKIPVNYLINNMYSLLPFSPTAGILMDWFGANFYKRKNYYAVMEKDISKSQLNKNGIILLPYFIDTSMLHRNLKSSGLFYGINLNHKKRDFARSVFEAVGFLLKENLSAIEKKINFEINSILSVGGASKSDCLNQIKADITGRKIVTTANSEVGCLGVAMLSAVANKYYKDLGQAAGNMVKIRKIYEPDFDSIKTYQEKFEIYKDLLDSATELFSKYY